MKTSRTDREDFRNVSVRLGIDAKEVEKGVKAFFDAVKAYSRSLPFDNKNKIYSKGCFDQFVRVSNIPYIGRIGPVYSRYLEWRKNESRRFLQEPRSSFRTRIPQSEIENMARDILSGIAPAPLKKRKGSELYERIWLVRNDGKKLARQVIPKKQEDV